MDIFTHTYAPLYHAPETMLLIARLILGVVMVYYGAPKIMKLKSNAKDFVSMGFKPGWFWGTLIAFVEFFGGIMVILGLWMWIPVALFGFEMAVGTLWKVTKTNKPFTDYSYDILLLGLSIVLLTFGPGTLFF